MYSLLVISNLKWKKKFSILLCKPLVVENSGSQVNWPKYCRPVRLQDSLIINISGRDQVI